MTEQQAVQEQGERKELIQQVEYWLSLNRVGRQLVQRGNQRGVPLALWPLILAKKPLPNVSSVSAFKGPHELFFLLQENPELFDRTLSGAEGDSSCDEGAANRSKVKKKSLSLLRTLWPARRKPQTYN